MVGRILQSGPKQRKYHILVYRLDIPWFLIFPDPTLLYFAGVAIWIFFILPNANDLPSGITSNTALNFTLDGLLVHTYLSPQPNENTPPFQYNVCGYSGEDYSNVNHTMVISTNDYPINTYVNFDYAVYTYVYSVIAPSTCGSNINLGVKNPTTLPHRLQALHSQDLQQPIIHRPTT